MQLRSSEDLWDEVGINCICGASYFSQEKSWIMVATYEIPYKDESIYGTLYTAVRGSSLCQIKEAVMVFLNHNINSPLSDTWS